MSYEDFIYKHVQTHDSLEVPILEKRRHNRLKFNTQISKVHVKYLDFFKTKYLLHASQ